MLFLGCLLKQPQSRMGQTLLVVSFFVLFFFELIIYSCGLQLDIHTVGNRNVLAKILLETLQEGTVTSVEENLDCIFY